ncbi:MAG: PPC domain-containing protein [Lewinellaceae bacterium]|nr:PPC domain-containing protein [Lewinellaceae bacterium]
MKKALRFPVSFFLFFSVLCATPVLAYAPDEVVAAPPSNDACANAVALTVNPDLECSVALNATTIDATASVPAISGCSGTADDDVWFSFVATGPSHRVKITNGTQSLVLQVFSGTCGSLVSLVCNDAFSGNLEQQVNNLTAGTTYYLRVYTRNNLAFTNFTICVGTPPPAPANDECAGAVALTVNPNLDCGTVLNTTTSGGLQSQAGCSGTADDDVWYKFVATGPSHRVKITGRTGRWCCRRFQALGGNLTSLVCNSPFSGNLEQQLNNLTAGQTYYLHLWPPGRATG